MNRDRLQDIYKNTYLADKSDIENIRQMTLDYPYYNLPYVILSKYYHDTQHYKFEDMLRQAAMRVKDRQALYEYIHGKTESDSHLPVEKEIEVIEEQKEESLIENVDLSVDAFLTDDTGIIEQDPEIYPSELAEEENTVLKNTQPLAVLETKSSIEEFIEKPAYTEPETQAEKPSEFVLDTHHEVINIDNLDVDHDIIGEEIATEFSFSKSFGHEEATEIAEPEVEESQEEKIDEAHHEVVDNTHESAHVSKESLEKANYFKDAIEHEPKIETQAHSSEMDFFAWLKAPKSQEAKAVKTTEEEEQVLEEIKADVVEAESIVPKTEEKVEENLKEEEEHTGSNLDLIDRFIQTNPQITRPKKEFFNPENMAKKSEVIDLEFVSETLANIFYEQGNYDLAIRAYEKLSLQNPSKQTYFADLIEKIRKERK